ncbi:HepT-like ribonuclease domain-containing protein [Paenibacillus filicis]|uniref:HepT-like ribonuclease domain-containing protein n=1 Tax=Paenibacillus filicis TaxID=669464 RepID=A0ABU9DCI3_9BACL
MYYVNQEQIDRRLSFIPTLLQACRELQEESEADDFGDGALLFHLAQERTLVLAIETVTDVGSLLIDAFMMRDASSYEDIVDILTGENVFGEEVASVLVSLVQMRRFLTQDYTEISRTGLHPLIRTLPEALEQFAASVPAFINKEVL